MQVALLDGCIATLKRRTFSLSFLSEFIKHLSDHKEPQYDKTLYSLR